jgi:hypothetical protein
MSNHTNGSHLYTIVAMAAAVGVVVGVILYKLLFAQAAYQSCYDNYPCVYWEVEPGKEKCVYIADYESHKKYDQCP